VPPTFGPNVRDVTALNLVGGRHAEPSIKHVRDIRPLHGRLFIGMGTRLFADQVYLSHQLAYLESPDLHAVLFHHQHDAPAARSVSALRKQLVHAAARTGRNTGASAEKPCFLVLPSSAAFVLVAHENIVATPPAKFSVILPVFITEKWSIQGV